MPKDPITLNDCPEPKYDMTMSIYQYETPACGVYQITREADEDLRDDPKYSNNRYLLAGAVREATDNGHKVLITTSNIDEIISTANKPENPIDAINRILMYIFKFSKLPYEFIAFDWLDYTLTYSRDFKEFEYYLEKAHELGFTEIESNVRTCRLTLEGWRRVEELLKSAVTSSQAFVAMWFDPQMDAAWKEGFLPALTQTGFKPIRSDLIQHNDRIDDRIIAEIRRSGLLVADFTGNRGGVYFEAGFALGLGRNVIWTCRADSIEKVHFDTRQYSHILWSDTSELRDKLVSRIEATITNR